MPHFIPPPFYERDSLQAIDLPLEMITSEEVVEGFDGPTLSGLVADYEGRFLDALDARRAKTFEWPTAEDNERELTQMRGQTIEKRMHLALEERRARTQRRKAAERDVEREASARRFRHLYR